MKRENLKIVVIANDPVVTDFLRSVILQNGGLSFCFQNASNFLDNLEVLNPDGIVVGALETGSVIRLLTAFQAVQMSLPVLVVTGGVPVSHYASLNQLNNVKILNDYSEFQTFCVRILQEGEPSWRMPGKSGAQPFIGNSPPMVKIKRELPVLSRTGDSILIKGEKGVGKEALARLIHSNSPGRGGLLIKVDATVLAHKKTEWGLIDLFRDAAAGAGEGKAGDCYPAGGTLYVDEICDASESMQAELLLIMEGSRLDLAGRRLHGLGEYRILAGTSKDVDDLVSRQKFRKDLYYRMNVFNLKIPPLRDRREDILELADFFTYKYCRAFNKGYFELSKTVKNAFLRYDWPQNVQELENAVKRAVETRRERAFLAGFEKRIAPADKSLPTQVLKSIEGLLAPEEYVKKIDKMSLKDICWDRLAAVEKNVMKKVLDSTNWNRKKAALMLNISYKSMLNKIKEYGLA